MVRCSGCAKTLPVSHFTPDPSRSTGCHTYCRPCAAERFREYRRTHLAECRERERRSKRAARAARKETA